MSWLAKDWIIFIGRVRFISDKLSLSLRLLKKILEPKGKPLTYSVIMYKKEELESSITS